jgi:uncharacterized protein (TIGR02284 family)
MCVQNANERVGIFAKIHMARVKFSLPAASARRACCRSIGLNRLTITHLLWPADRDVFLHLLVLQSANRIRHASANRTAARANARRFMALRFCRRSGDCNIYIGMYLANTMEMEFQQHQRRGVTGHRRPYGWCSSRMQAKEIFMKTDTATLKELVEVLNDGEKFYREASIKVKQPELRQLFSRMARTKAAIAGDLKTKIVMSGKSAPDGGSFSGSLRKAYGEVAASLSKTPNVKYVDQLEGFEDRIVEAFRAAVDKSDDAEVRALAEKYMPEVLRDHDKMSTLKHTMSPQH